jgi:hypothetical protein
MESASKDKRTVSERLRATTDELQTLERLVLSGDCAPRVLAEFRTAVDSIRQTAWAVQQWHELQQQHRDPYAVLGILSAERVRRANQRSDNGSRVSGTGFGNRGTGEAFPGY